MKGRSILAVLTAMMILVSGCGSGMDLAETEALLAQAKETMASVNSMEAVMTMEMDMGMNGEVMETTTLAEIRTQQNPLRMQMELSMLMSDGTEIDQMQMYAMEEDGHLRTYVETEDTWYAETLELDALHQYNAEENMDLYLDNITAFHAAGQEKIHDTETTKITGVIAGDAMEEVIAGSGLTASAESMGLTEEMLAEVYAELSDLPISLWIDAEGYVRQYELDMTEMMQKVMDASMKAVGMAEADISVKVEKTLLTMVCSAFNAVGEITMPEEAIGIPAGEHIHAE